MPHAFAELAFTPDVRRVQEELGSRAIYSRSEGGEESHRLLGAEEAAFLEARDSFYMATVGAGGWPYVQHRGGPAGFVRVLDETTIGFADFRGNRQYVSVGNLAGDGRVSLIFVDYPNRRRLKLLGYVRFVGPDDPVVLERLALPGYRARIERGFLIDVAAWDWNCPQHITPRFTQAEVAEAVAPLHARIAELERQLAGRFPAV